MQSVMMSILILEGNGRGLYDCVSIRQPQIKRMTFNRLVNIKAPDQKKKRESTKRPPKDAN